MKMLTMTNLSTECLIQLTKLGYDATPFNQILKQNAKREMRLRLGKECGSAGMPRSESGSAGMPRPISYAVFCLKKKTMENINCSMQELQSEIMRHLLR